MSDLREIAVNLSAVVVMIWLGGTVLIGAAARARSRLAHHRWSVRLRDRRSHPGRARYL